MKVLRASVGHGGRRSRLRRGGHPRGRRRPVPQGHAGRARHRGWCGRAAGLRLIDVLLSLRLVHLYCLASYSTEEVVDWTFPTFRVFVLYVLGVRGELRVDGRRQIPIEFCWREIQPQDLCCLAS